MTTLTLKIEGPPGRVPATALASVLTETLAILEDLRRSVARGEPVTWYVTDLKMGSAEAALSAADTTEAPFRLCHELVAGMAVAEAGEALPAYFSDASLRRLRRMARPLGTQDARYLDARVSQNGTSESARTTKISSDNIEKLRSPRSRALGSITGVLDTISTRTRSKSQRLQFQVFDPVSRRPVTCHFPKERTESVKDALDRQVVVRGTVVRNATGQPVRVDDAELEVLTEAPPLVNLVGIDPDFTGGLSLHEYMERLIS